MLNLKVRRPRALEVGAIAERVKAAGVAVDSETSLNKLAIAKVVDRLVELIPGIVWVHREDAVYEADEVVGCGSNSCEGFHNACEGEVLDLPGCDGGFTPCEGLSQCDVEDCARAHSCSGTHDCGQNSGGSCSGELVCSDTHGPGETETADGLLRSRQAGVWYTLIARLAASRPSLDDLGERIAVATPAPKPGA